MTQSTFTDTCPPAGGGAALVSDSGSDLASLLAPTAYDLLLNTCNPSSVTRRLGDAASWVEQVRLTLDDCGLAPQHCAALRGLQCQIQALQCQAEALGALLAGPEQ